MYARYQENYGGDHMALSVEIEDPENPSDEETVNDPYYAWEL